MKLIQTELTTKEILKLGEYFETVHFAEKRKDGKFKKQDGKIWEFLNSLIPIK